MQAPSQETFVDIFSEARLKSYSFEGYNEEQVFTLYQNNILLSEALYPALHYFEIILRNQLNKAIIGIYGPDWLINLHENLKIDDRNIENIQKLTSNYRKNKQKDPLHDDLVAQMTFGFWANFFHKRYDQVLWHRKGFAANVFPYLERSKLSSHEMRPKIQNIKDLRNRIAHHEPIWNRQPSPSDIHALCLDFIRGMSEKAFLMLLEIDRFKSIIDTHNMLGTTRSGGLCPST